MALLNKTNTNVSASCTVDSSVERSMYPTAYSLFFIVGFPANCLSLYVAWMLIRSGNSIAVYLFNLSISDLLYAISLPVWIELALRKYVDKTLCSLVTVIMYNSFYVGSGLLCCISVDRFLAVVYPLHFHWVREVRTAAYVSIAVWTLEISMHVILLDHTGALRAFSSRSCTDQVPMTAQEANVSLTRVTLGFLVPVFIMTFCFQQIMQSLRQSSSILEEERRKVGVLLLFLLLTYIVAFLPFQTVMLLRAVLEPGACVWAARLRNPYLVTVATTTINSTLDPIIYCLISESAKREIRKVIEKGRGVLKKSKLFESFSGIQYELMKTTSAMENLTLATNLSDCFLDDDSFRRKPFMVFYMATIMAAIPTNAFSLYVSLQHIRQKNELGVYLFNLALSDLTFSIGLSLWLDFLWRGVWAHGGHVCVLSIYFLFTNFYTSDAFLCCIAFDRYLAVVHPLKYRFLRKVDTAAVVSAAIWVLVVCFNAATITWEDSYYESSKFSVCFDIFLPMSETMVRANIARFLLGFIFPVFLVVFSTRGTFKALKSNQATEEKERKQIAKLLTVVLLCLLLSFGPIHIMMLVRTIVDDCKTVALLLYPYKISQAMSSLNCISDPLLYCFITRTGKENVNQVVLLFQVKKRSKDESVV
ncbi:C-X-C chemokine receptor type 2-like [Cheilinus undulatus]|uniref:C-X-C chemokine receptor type 2-like n=1 Tax=Cheilinus undulatus TaxID=241271 RepID=UPI001BD2026C|nr:C-X-C chemokine receptor type 2-like [Cheilinus undulatus]